MVVVAVRVEGVEDLGADHPLHLVPRHVAVQRHRDDEVDVVDARVREEREDHLGDDVHHDDVECATVQRFDAADE